MSQFVSKSVSASADYLSPMPQTASVIYTLTSEQQNYIDTLYQSFVRPARWCGEEYKEDKTLRNFRILKRSKGSKHVHDLFHDTCHDVFSQPENESLRVLDRLPELSIGQGAHPTEWHTRMLERNFVMGLANKVRPIALGM